MAREPQTREEAIEAFIEASNDLEEAVKDSGAEVLMRDFRPLLDKLYQAAYDRGRAHERHVR